MRQLLTWLGEFKILFFVYTIAAAVGMREFLNSGAEVDLVMAPDNNYADLMAEVYPDRGETAHILGSQAGMCFVTMGQQSVTSPACRKYENVDLRRKTIDLFEKALATGIKHSEDLYYDYAMIIQSEGDPEKSARAAEAWRRNFPLSTRLDPLSP